MPIFHFGQPLCSQLPNAQWKRIPTLKQRQLIWSLCVGISIGLCIAFIWRTYYGTSLPLGSPSWEEIALSAIILSIGHEAIHLLGFPYCGLNAKTVIGIWPQVGSPYVQYLLPMSRNRFITVALLPFLVLSLLPFTLAYGNVASVDQLSWISVLNCVGAGSDIFIASRVLFIVPSKASVIENADALYWWNSKFVQ